MEKWRCRFTAYNGCQLNVFDVRAADASIAVVFADIKYVRSIRAVRFYIDATFKICPRQPKVLQFLTTMAEVDDCVVRFFSILVFIYSVYYLRIYVCVLINHICHALNNSKF